jgi:hypothetical protein
MTEASAETRWRRRVIASWLSLLVGSFGAAAGPEQAMPESFAVGQRWEYQHEGPRPGNIEPNAIDGQRILHVISAIEGPEGKQWVIEERFTNDKGAIGRVHVNQQQMLTLLEIENKKGEVAKLRYDPPIPYRVMDLAVGEKRKIETTLRMDAVEFSLPSVITVERLEDETITTPAGAFVGCRHYCTTTASTVNIKIAKIPITEERQQWYHDSIHGAVKEIYRRGPVKFLTWSREGYTATSVLTAFGQEEVTPAPAPAVADRPMSRRPPEAKPQAASHAGRALVLLGAIAILSVSCLVLLQRARRK